MKLVIGADGAGKPLLDVIAKHLGFKGVDVTDLSPPSGATPEFYADTSERAGLAIAKGEFDRGILFCGTGIGVCISANKVSGIRAALTHDTYSAAKAATSNNAQIITLGAQVGGRNWRRPWWTRGLPRTLILPAARPGTSSLSTGSTKNFRSHEADVKRRAYDCPIASVCGVIVAEPSLGPTFPSVRFQHHSARSVRLNRVVWLRTNDARSRLDALIPRNCPLIISLISQKNHSGEFNTVRDGIPIWDYQSRAVGRTEYHLRHSRRKHDVETSASEKAVSRRQWRERVENGRPDCLLGCSQVGDP